MPLVFKNKRGDRVEISGYGEVNAGGKTVSTARFSDSTSETVFIPRDTTGFIKLSLDITLVTHDPKRPMQWTNSVTVQWTYSRWNGSLEVPVCFVTPGRELGSGPFYKLAINPSSDKNDQSVSVQVSATWDFSVPIVDPNEMDSTDILLTLTHMPQGRVTFGRAWMTREVEFVPFVTNSRDKLVRKSLFTEVRDWFTGLHRETQTLVETAVVPADMPMGQPFVIEGYTSTCGNQAYNSGLGWHRAQAVLSLIRQITGNNNPAVFRTPSIGEGSRATDIKREEDNRPECRKVVIRFGDTFDF
jgi:hypothetical protein